MEGIINMIKLMGINKEFRVRDNKQVKVLSNILLDFPETGLIAFYGRNGSGKTTLFNIISGLLKPTSGEILFNNINYKDLSNDQFDFLRNKYISFIFQDYNLISQLTVIENVRLVLDANDNDNKIYSILSEVGILDLKDRYISELSGGERQKVVIARSLVKGSKVLLADEPTASLDEESGISIIKLLKDLSKKMLVLWVSHDSSEINENADRIIKIKCGTIIDDIVINKENTLNDDENINLNDTNRKINFIHLFNLSNKILNKKIKRFAFTVIFWVISLSLFLFSSMYISTNKIDITNNTLKENDITYLRVASNEYYDYKIDDRIIYDNIVFKDGIENYEINNYYDTYKYSFVLKGFTDGELTKTERSKENAFFILDAWYDKKQIESQTAFEFIEVIDKYETNEKTISLSDGEVILTDYLASKFIYYEIIKVDSIDEVIGKTIIYNYGNLNCSLKIKDIIDTDYEKFLKPEYTKVDQQGVYSFLKSNEFIIKANNEYSTIYMNEVTFDRMLVKPRRSFRALLNNKSIEIANYDKFKDDYADQSRYGLFYGALPKDDDEVLVGCALLSLIAETDNLTDEIINDYIGKEVKISFFSTDNPTLFPTTKKFKICGVASVLFYSIQVKDNQYLKLVKSLEVGTLGNLVCGQTIKLKANNTSLIKMMYENNGMVNNYLYHDLENVNENLAIEKKTAGYLLIFATIILILVLYYFSSSLITSNTKTIGILASLGYKRKNILWIILMDIFKMFIIAFLVSVIVVNLYIFYMNNLDEPSFIVSIRTTYFKLGVMFIDFIASLIVSILSSIIPLYRLLRKDTIDIIYDR